MQSSGGLDGGGAIAGAIISMGNSLNLSAIVYHLNASKSPTIMGNARLPDGAPPWATIWLRCDN